MTYLSFLLVLIFGLFLWLTQWVVRRGTPVGCLTSTEAFVLGHWIFLFLNLILLLWTGGRDWAELRSFSQGTFWMAGVLVFSSLLAYVLGAALAGYFAEKAIGTSARIGLRSKSYSEQGTGEAPLLTVLGIILLVIGGGSTAHAALAVTSGENLEARATATLVLSQLVVPGTILLACAMRESKGFVGRIALTSLVVIGATVSLALYSRRPSLVLIGALWLMWGLRPSSTPSRKQLFMALPFVGLLAIGLFYSRNLLLFGTELDQSTAIDFYLDRLWLELSALSALLFIIQHQSIDATTWGTSFGALLLFWLPRAVLPEKPEGYDMVLMHHLDVPYNIGPSLYGELLENLSYFGVLPAMFLVGALLRFADVLFYSARHTRAEIGLYCIFVLNALFLVRGALNAMVVPIFIQVMIPWLCLWGLRRARSALRTAIAPPRQDILR